MMQQNLRVTGDNTQFLLYNFYLHNFKMNIYFPFNGMYCLKPVSILGKIFEPFS